MKIVERIYLVNPKLLIDEMTITDPEVLAAPYVMRTPFKPDTAPLREYVCAENNRLTSDEQVRRQHRPRAQRRGRSVRGGQGQVSASVPHAPLTNWQARAG